MPVIGDQRPVDASAPEKEKLCREDRAFLFLQTRRMGEGEQEESEAGTVRR